MLGASWYEHPRCGSRPCVCTPEELALEAEEERAKTEAASAMTPAQWAQTFTIETKDIP